MIPIQDYSKETQVFEIQRALVRRLGIDQPIIFDIGANRGEVTKNYLQEFPNAILFCFEPNLVSYRYLEERWGGDKRVSLYNCGIGSCNNKVEFNIYADSEVCSVLPVEKDVANKNTSGAYQLKEKTEINIVSVDYFSLENSIEKIDILKTDTQGYDLEVLKGAVKMLKNQKINLVFCEVYFAKSYENQCYFHDIASFMYKYDYKFFNFLRLVQTDDGRAYFGDAVFLSDSSWKKLNFI